LYVFSHDAQEIASPGVLHEVVKLGTQWLWHRSSVARGNGDIRMPRGCRWIVFELLLAAPVLLAGTALAQSAPVQTSPTQAAAKPAQPKPPHHTSHKTEKPLVLPPLPSGPLSQLPMDQIPTTPAKVSFQDGLLSISAQNSTLGDILRDVRRLTGASIDIPPGSAANERVVTHLGPGAPREVLAVLLNGSSFNYVMIGSNSDPAAVSSVVLLPKAGSGADVQTVANASPNNQVPTPQNQFPRPGGFNRAQIIAQQNPQAGNAQPAEDDKSADDDSDSNADNADDQAQPAQQPGANGQDQVQPTDPNQPNSGPKTPEQILEMLRRPQQQPGGGVVTTPQQPPDQ
jgi:hypothetical protein